MSQTGQILLWVGLCIGALGPVIALIIAVVGVIMMRRANVVRRWPTVTGKVLSTEIRSYRGSDQMTVHRPYVVYEYEVLGQRYQSDKLESGELQGQTSGRDPGGAQQWAARYPVGASVQVHYDPQQPSVAVLEAAGPTLQIFVLFGVAALVLFVMLGIGVVIALLGPTL